MQNNLKMSEVVLGTQKIKVSLRVGDIISGGDYTGEISLIKRKGNFAIEWDIPFLNDSGEVEIAADERNKVKLLEGGHKKIVDGNLHIDIINLLKYLNKNGTENVTSKLFIDDFIAREYSSKLSMVKKEKGSVVNWSIPNLTEEAGEIEVNIEEKSKRILDTNLPKFAINFLKNLNYR